MFYTGNNTYKELVEDKTKFIISGKKGTGKTILAKYFELEQNKNKIPTRLLTDRDVVLKQFIETGKIDLDNSQRELFIEYTILTEVGKLIIENKKQAFSSCNIFKWCRLMQKINYIQKIVNERTPVDNFYSPSYDLNEKLSDKIFGEASIKKDTSVSSGLEIIAEQETRKTFIKNPFYNILEKLKECVKFILQYMSVNLIFDDLDEYDDIITGNEKYIGFFNDFIKVTNRINSDIYCSETKCSRVIIIIRSDMLQPLNNASKNLNKIIADGQIKLNWIKKVSKGRTHPLMELIITKIKNSNPLLKNLNDEEIISRFFCETVKGIPLINYMLNASFGRPRDIINMLNVIIDYNKNATKFTSKYFQQTRKDYSELFLNELRNELASHFSSEQIEECLWIIKKINKNEFWLSELSQIIYTYGTDLKYYKTEREFYKFAYEFGIIGNVWHSMDEKGNQCKGYSWKYREDGRDIPDETQKFCLHFALSNALIHK